jgi:hypothetical protein
MFGVIQDHLNEMARGRERDRVLVSFGVSTIAIEIISNSNKVIQVISPNEDICRQTNVVHFIYKIKIKKISSLKMRVTLKCI